MRFFKTRVLLWPLLAIIVIFMVGTGGAFAYGAVNGLSLASVFGSSSDARDTEVINSITREEQVVLVRLGIEGLDQQKSNGKVFGIVIPGTERALFVRYSFDAKLGIEGKDVTVTKTGADSFLVSIPHFEFIGFDEAHFETAVEQNGLLGWTTPAIDKFDVVNKILDADDKKQKYIDNAEDVLQDQAKAFYTAIITSIDPDITVDFEFAQ